MNDLKQRVKLILSEHRKYIDPYYYDESVSEYRCGWNDCLDEVEVDLMLLIDSL